MFSRFFLFCNLYRQNIPTEAFSFLEYLRFYGVKSMIQSKQIDSIDRVRIVSEDSEYSVLASVSETIDDRENSLTMSLLGLIQGVDAATDIAAAISPILFHVCEATNWDYGEIWIPSANSKVLELSNVWQIASNTTDETSLDRFRLGREGLVISPGEGFPGRVWLSEKFEWIDRATANSESYCAGNQLARAFDIIAGFGVPIIASERVWAAVVLFELGIDRPIVVPDRFLT
jgi:hypothetical protein